MHKVSLQTVGNITQGAITIASLYTAFKLYQVMQKGAVNVGGPIGKAAAKVQQFLNGNHDIEASAPGVPLTDLGLEKHGENQYYMSASRRQAIAGMHDENQTIIDAVFTADGYVRGPFLSFINQKPVTLADI